MKRNEKKKKTTEKSFMFLYACGISRVHQEFELFEQILKIVLILQKKCCRLISMIQANVTDEKCFSLFSHVSPPPFYPLLCCGDMLKVLVDLSAGELQKGGIYKRQTL